MSYQVLARKWRPQCFQNMVGQTHVLQALINALEQQRLHHAYLFTGTRGVGKTTIARIFAKCLNCEQGISATPCRQCDNCLAIEQGRFIDLIEVDAASRTSVEDTRELLNNVQYAPTAGRFKVYLIDEVHMLSGHSFNALLKTLEEPPEHVKFLLATTDPQKLPVTVLSRCLQFHLKNMLPEQIEHHLQDVLNQEAISFEPAALTPLARAADGSMRDALSLLDQAIAYANGQLTAQAVSQMLGTIEQAHLDHLLQALMDQQASTIIEEINHLAEQGADFNTVLEDLLSALHQIALLQMAPDLSLETSSNNIHTFAQQLTKEDVQLWYQIALIGRRDLPLAPTTRIGFEMVLLRMLAFQPTSSPTDIPTASTPTTKDTAKKKTPPITESKSTSLNIKPVNTEPPKTAASTTEKSTPVIENLDWPTLHMQLDLSGPTLSLASHCSLQTVKNDHIEFSLESSYKPLLNDQRQQQIAAALSQHLGKAISVSIHLGTTSQATPAQLATQQADEQQQTAEEAITNDASLQELVKTFDANIAAQSVKTKEATET